MASKYNHRPPDTDDSEGEGFYFNDEETREERHQSRYHWVQTNDNVYNVLQKGDLTKLKEQIEIDKHDVNSIINETTLLLSACREGFVDIVEYLVIELKANVNKQVDSYTPLMNACDCFKKEHKLVERIVFLLLKHGAIINVSNKYGVTPFMLACKNGYANVVRFMLKNVSFDAVDNFGCSPIFFAVENNRIEIVKILVEAGVNTTIPNKKGYTPLLVAEFFGFNDILEILPKRKETYQVPVQFIQYSSLRDYIPRLFLKTECPDYFQDINTILKSIGMEKMLDYFAKSRLSLAEFLCITDERLQEIGVQYPLYRMKIAQVLLDFHLYHWSAKAIGVSSKARKKDDFYKILMITANHLQQCVITTASLRYVKINMQKGYFGTIYLRDIKSYKQDLIHYENEIDKILKTTKHLGTLSPSKNILYIDYDEFLAQRKRRRKIKMVFKLTSLIIGISLVVCLKMKNVF